MRLYDTVPHPFIMYIPAAFRNGKRPKIVSKPPFDEVEVELTLFGKSIGFLPYFIYTFARLGEKGLGKDRVAFTLEEVRTLPEDCVIYNKGDSQISDNWKTDDLVITGNSVKYLKKRMRVILESPLRIQKEGRIIKKIELRPFFTTLLRRLFSLFYFHSGETLDWDYNHLADLSEKLKVIKDNTGVESLSRFSTRQKKSMRFDGISGDFVLEGKLGALYEILQAGTITHLGKTTSFGMGKYRLEEI